MADQTTDEEFQRILRERDLRTVFQPITHLDSKAIIGYEALVRGPEGSVLSSPEALLAAAHRADQVVELDWAARACACREALAAGLDREQLLFLNIEPIALDSDCPADLWPDIERAFARFRVVLEVTERSLDRDPGTLLDGIHRLRPVVAGIALDDVGAHPTTLAMLPLVAPTIIKIDRGVTQAAPGAEVARVLDSVHEEGERTGALILAEGLETAHHLDQATAFGAHLGQGFRFGGPGPLLSHDRRRHDSVELRTAAPLAVATPFAALAGAASGPADPQLLVALTRHMSTCADATAPALHIALLPSADLLDEAELARLARLAGQGTFCAVLGPEIAPEPGRGIRGVGLRHEAQPAAEWAAVTVGACFSGAVLARQVPDADGTWYYGITHDKSRTIAAARSLVRLLGAPEPRFHFGG